MKYYTLPTPNGTMTGLDFGDYAEFRGIPFAMPPVGELRFRSPKGLPFPNGSFTADTYAPRCPQTKTNKDSFYGREFYDADSEKYGQSEDCLYLNFWVPKKHMPHGNPVAVWIHGGAFYNGYSYEKELDGAEYAKRGVILVTVGYRLGVWGLLTVPERMREEGHTGNYGILDQVAALRWIREYISIFGGDPENVTVFGQSAGAMSVQYLCSSPLTKGLFQRAIMQSGAGILADTPPDFTLEEGFQIYRELLEKLSITTVRELEQIPAPRLQEIFQVIQEEHGPLLLRPFTDGYLLEDSILVTAVSGRLHPLSYMFGATSNDIQWEQPSESGKGVFFDAVIRLSQSLKAHGHRPPYLYYFNHPLPGNDDGAFHSSELWYMFGTIHRCWRPMDGTDAKLSEKMLDYWSNFMKTGNPNSPDGSHPLWQPYRTAGDELVFH